MFNASAWLLDRHVEAGGAGRTCFHEDDAHVSYGEVYERVTRAGRVFADAGIEPGDRVLVATPDSVTAAVAILALIRIGAVPVPVSPLLKDADYRRVLSDSRPQGLIIASGLAELAEYLSDAAARRRVWVDDPGATAPARSLWADLAASTRTVSVAPTRADDIALIQYTSGSTGTPRGVVHRHRALPAAVRGLIERAGLEPDDVCLSASKLAFGYGFGNSVLVPLSIGASSVLTRRRMEPAVVAQELRRHRPTVLFAVPTLYAALLTDADASARFPLRRLRAYVSSGEHLGARLGARCRSIFGPALVNVFGCTETLYSFMSNLPGAWEPDVLGVPFTGCEVRAEPAGDDAGKLWVRAPGAAAGYWNRPADTAETFRDGWVRTGDYVRSDGEGRLHYLGRADDLLNVGGVKVAPSEIEEIARGHPAVDACAVVGAPDTDGLTRMVLFVVPSVPPHTGLASDVRRHLRGRLGAERRPAIIALIDELPRTSTGKLSRPELRRRAQIEIRRLRDDALRPSLPLGHSRNTPP